MLKEPAESAIVDLSDAVRRALSPRPASPGFAVRGAESVRPITMPPWFMDRCRRAYLSAMSEDAEGSRVLGITSALRGEGRTSLAIGVATAIAADTQRPTLLLECDMEKPSFNRYFGIETQTGLVDWLEGSANLLILRGGPLVNLFVIPSGAARSDPSHLFYQLSEGGAIGELRRHFSTVVIDLPPMLSIAYSSLASRLSERILLVARYGVTPVEDLEKAVFLLGRERLSGIVLNGTEYRTPEVLRRLF